MFYLRPKNKSDAAELTDFLDFARKSMASASLEALVDDAIGFYLSVQPRSLLCVDICAQAYAQIQCEEEKQHLALLDLLPKPDGKSDRNEAELRSFLLESASRYVEVTRYLFPVITHFARSVCRANFGVNDSNRPIYLFLRDALSFWPAISAAAGPDRAEDLHFILYTRQMKRRGDGLRVVSPCAQNGYVETRGEVSPQGLLIDVGLYGSLLPPILERGARDPQLSVIFLGSRNPFIFGWLNAVLNGELVAGNSKAELLDIIRTVDTVESLLKGFVMSEGVMRLTDPVSFVCSMAFLWSLRRYAETQEHASLSPAACVETLIEAKRDGRSWFLNRVVPRWAEADAFVSGWEHGPVFPMSLVSGFKL